MGKRDKENTLAALEMTLKDAKKWEFEIDPNSDDPEQYIYPASSYEQASYFAEELGNLRDAARYKTKERQFYEKCLSKMKDPKLKVQHPIYENQYTRRGMWKLINNTKKESDRLRRRAALEKFTEGMNPIPRTFIRAVKGSYVFFMLLFSVFFLSPQVTGFAISNSGLIAFNILGVASFTLFLIFAWFYVNKIRLVKKLKV